MSGRRVTVDVDVTVGIEMTVDDLYGEPWPEEVTLTAGELLDRIKASYSRHGGEPDKMGFCSDSSLLEAPDIRITVTVIEPNEHGTNVRTMAVWT